MPAAKVDAETAPNMPAVARPSTFPTPFQRASVTLPSSTMAMPTTPAPMAGIISSDRFASRTEMPAPRPTFSKRTRTMNL